jgi:hypothetical protein
MHAEYEDRDPARLGFRDRASVMEELTSTVKQNAHNAPALPAGGDWESF